MKRFCDFGIVIAKPIAAAKVCRVAVLLAGLSVLLSGCFEGVSTSSNPITSNTPGADYTGPAARTADIQAFRINVWENLRAQNRCGNCHNTNGQAPSFVREDDVNLAYNDANLIAELTSPADSRMVTKVAAGHNCWLASNGACAAIITNYIEAWAGASGISSGRQIVLKAPPIKDAGASKLLPVDSALFAGTVHPLLTNHCANCHAETSPTPQAPFFAESDVGVAYDAAKPKIDLDNPDISRLVVRLRSEFHNCWSGDCQADATAMENQIIAFAGQVPTTPVDPALVLSKALNLFDGIVASGGSRHEANQIALWEFKTGQGSIAYDTSGVEPAINLTLSGDVSWVGGWGLEFRNGKAQGSTASSKKLHDLIKSTGEYSVEGWIVPGNVTQEGPARIISYSGGTNTRNFTLGQTQYNYDFLHRSGSTDANGAPALSTADADEDLQATEQHVVVTFDPVNGRRIFVNGVFTDDPDPAAAGSINDWDDSFAFVLGNEVSSNRTWAGKLRMVAIHNRALTAEQIAQNHRVGVGEKYFLLFNVTDLVNLPESYILIQVSQFDSYSYLFNQPRFISLDSSVQPNGIPLSGMRIGMNGREVDVGQSYTNISTTLGGSLYTPAEGQYLSNLGTVIAAEKGADSDEFFLTFEVLGNNTNVYTWPTPLTPPPPPDASPMSDIGLRIFEEISASMAAVTGVSRTESNVQATYESVKQQLPSVENIEGFLSAHQVAVSQMAIEFCNALVDNSSLRSSYFPGFVFTANAQTAFDTTPERNQVLDPLLQRMMGTGLSTQPDFVAVKTELNSLIDGLTACGGGCAADRTEIVVKATCAATLGNAALLLQ